MKAPDPAVMAIMWRCRRCGKWSHAKRDPIAHKPERPDDDGVVRAEWCGPFDRWTARHTDAEPRPNLPHVGQPVHPYYRTPPPDTSPDIPF